MNKVKQRIIKKFQSLGIRFKFVFSVLSLFVIGVISLSIFFTNRIDTLLIENLEQKLNLIENNFSVIVKNSLLESSYSTLNTLIRRISGEDKELKYIVVMDQTRNILAASDEKKYPFFYRVADPDISEKIQNKDESIFFTEEGSLIAKLSLIYFDKEGALSLGDFSDDLENLEDLSAEDTKDTLKRSNKEIEDVIRKKEGSQNTSPQGYLYVALSTEYVKAEISHVWLFSVILLFIILTMGYFIAYAIGSSLAQPLADLASKVREIAKGNLKVLIDPISRKDEIGQLVSDAEEMRLSIKFLTENLEDKVKQRTYQLQQSQDENEKILNTMRTGLFSINKYYVIGSQYSKVTEKIFETNELAQAGFFTILKKCMNSDQLRVTDKYLTILFNNTINDAFTADLNPLQSVQMEFKPDLIKYVRFAFYRIYVNGGIIGVMIILDDVTEAYLLSKKLEENQKKLDSQKKQLVAILDIDSQSLAMLISDTDQDITDIRQLLKKEEFNRSDLDHVYRIVHSIKGNASILNLELISEVAHSGEEEIIKIQKSKKIESEDISILNNIVSEINISMKQVKELIKKLKRFKSTYKEAGDINVLMLESVKKTIDRISKAMDKGVNFDYQEFDTKLLNDKNRKIVKDVLIQLIRNSINHGIESFKERKQLGKPMNGRIVLKSDTSEKGFITLVVEDDGKGLDLEKLREKASTLKNFNSKEIHNWNDEKLIELIFQPGFSTQEEVNLTAGRGIGMDIVRKEVKKFGGKVKVNSERGKYFRIKIGLPETLRN